LTSRRAGTERLPTVTGRRANVPFPSTPPRHNSPYRDDPDDIYGSGHGNNNPGPPSDPDPGGDPNDPNDPNDPDPDDDPDNPNPDPNPGNGPGDNPGQNDIAQALNFIATSFNQNRSNSTKIREPDTFDGSDPKKLQSFLVQCQLNFNDRPHAFHSDEKKVNFALSYLKGMALDWFEPGFMDHIIPPIWYTEYNQFVRELKTNFGPHDPIGDSEAELERLVMRDNQRATKYLVEFNRHASRLQWNDSALRRALYKGLPDRIKDEISRVGKPNSLGSMRNLIQTIDARYWERRSEMGRDNSSHSKPDQSSSKSQSDKKGKTPSHTHTTTTPSSSAKPSTSSSHSHQKPKPAQTQKSSDLSSKLGKDGKITDQERQRRIDNNLCLYCGGHGHTAKDCHKASNAKARAAKASKPEGKSDSPDASKKS
jgi:hypothetical protein